MTPLEAANKLHANLELAQAQLEGFLQDTLQAYIDFLPERGSGWVPGRYKKATDYSFTEVENKKFVFQSEEYYEYGDYEKDTVELPFAFVEDPQAYMTKERAEMAEKARQLTEAQRTTALTQVANLERQLEAARKRAGL